MLISVMSKKIFSHKTKMVLVLARQELHDFWSSPIGQVLQKKHWTNPSSKETLDKSENLFVFMEQLLLYQFLFACNYIAKLMHSP